MLILDSTTKTLEIILSGAITTNQLPWVVGYQEFTNSSFSSSSGSGGSGTSNSGSAVTVVSAPASGKTRQIKFLSVRNSDTVNTILTVRLNNNGTLRNYWKGTLDKGDSLIYVDGHGFYVLELAGRIKEGTIVIDLTTDVTGILPVPNGGTGKATLPIHCVIIGNDAGVVSLTATGTAGQPLMSGGSGADPNYTARLVPTAGANFGNKDVYFTQNDNGNSGTSKTIDWTGSPKQLLTRTGNCTLTFTAPGGPTNLILKLVHEASGTAYTITWPAAVKWPGAVAPTLTNTTGAVDMVSFYYDGTNYYGQSAAAFA